METGEILNEEDLEAYEELVSELNENVGEKIEGMIQIIKNAKAREEMFAVEIKSLQARKKEETKKEEPKKEEPKKEEAKEESGSDFDKWEAEFEENFN